MSHPDAQTSIPTHKLRQKCTHTHTSCIPAAKEGFIPRLQESDISMALSGVSMAIPCTEIIRGDPRLGPGSQRGQIYISSRAVKAPSPSIPLPACFSITVRASNTPHPLKTTLSPPLCAASSHTPSLTVPQFS